MGSWEAAADDRLESTRVAGDSAPGREVDVAEVGPDAEEALEGPPAALRMAELLHLLYDVVLGVLISAFYIARQIFYWAGVVAPPAPKSLAGQHVLVSGAGRGLGRELCLRLASEGCSQVTCLDIDAEGAEETARLVELRAASSTASSSSSSRTRARGVGCDVTDRSALSALLKTLPPVDVLINNAGIVSSASILDDTDQHIRRMIDVNLMAHFWTIRSVLPGMIERGRGHIVAIASAAAFTAAANIAPYTATKYAVTGMMASLREEMRRRYPWIKITSVHPFFISPPESCKQHWRKKSRMPDVTAAEVADKTIEGIKRDKSTVTVPSHLYHLLVLLMAIPVEAGDLWRDMFYAHISSLDEKKKTDQEN